MIEHQSSLDENGYWEAVVRQGKWAESVPFPLETREGVRINRIADPETEEAWQELDRCFGTGEVLTLTVSGYNKGGLLVEYGELQGFVPASQLADCTKRIEESLPERMDYLAERIEQPIKLKVIELDRAQNRIIFSERAARWQGRCPDVVIQELRPGDVCYGQVSNLCDFGVFVDLGGIDGLIHVSELSWRRVNHPRDVVSAGQEIEVYVIDVERDRRRIALSLKRLQPNPWATVADRYEPEQIVEGIITNVVDFGAFARIEDGVEGLIHISELGNGDVPLHPRSILNEGQRIRARVLNVDAEHQRMGLTLRGVPQPSSHHLVTPERSLWHQAVPVLEISPHDGAPTYA
jgi:small subunit ribosomal protein S1